METLLEKSLNKHDFPEKERRELAKEGEAMKDGSFPIKSGIWTGIKDFPYS
jgi:hypothetical protein